MSNRIGDNLVHFGGNEQLIRALDAAGARFMVVGGLAMAWHCPEREADDADLLLDPTPENSEKVANALSGLGLTNVPKTAFARLGLQVPLKNASFYAELLTPKDGGITYAEAEGDAAYAWLFQIPVRLASVVALRRMKSHAAESAFGAERQKHLDDLKLLEGAPS